MQLTESDKKLIIGALDARMHKIEQEAPPQIAKLMIVQLRKLRAVFAGPEKIRIVRIK